MAASRSTSFEDLPRSIATMSILPYVGSSDWLNFRASSRGCYQTVHDTTNVWHSSNRTRAPPSIPGCEDAANSDPSANNGGESDALWRLALARDYQFEGGATDDECLQSFHSPGVNLNDDDDAPFLSTRNMFTAPKDAPFISWKHWRKIDLCLHGPVFMRPTTGAPGTISGPFLCTISGPFFLRAGRMWQKIEHWCDRSGDYGQKIESTLSPGRPFYPNTSNANLSAFQAVYAFYAGQHDDMVTQRPTGLFGGFQAYDVISNTRWIKPRMRPRTHPPTQDYVVIARGAGKVISMLVSTGQVYSISRRNPQLVATPCPGGIDRHISNGHTLERPVNIADGKDSILRWFEEYAHRLHQSFYAVGILDPRDDDDGNDTADAMLSLLRYPTVNDSANCSRAVTRGVEVVASATLVEEVGMFVYSIRMRMLTPDDGDDYMSPEQRGFSQGRRWDGNIVEGLTNRPAGIVIVEIRSAHRTHLFNFVCFNYDTHACT